MPQMLMDAREGKLLIQEHGKEGHGVLGLDYEAPKANKTISQKSKSALLFRLET